MILLVLFWVIWLLGVIFSFPDSGNRLALGGWGAGWVLIGLLGLKVYPPGIYRIFY